MTDVRVKNEGEKKCWVETNVLEPGDRVELTISNDNYLDRLRSIDMLDVEVIE